MKLFFGMTLNIPTIQTTLFADALFHMLCEMCAWDVQRFEKQTASFVGQCCPRPEEEIAIDARGTYEGKQRYFERTQHWLWTIK